MKSRRNSALTKEDFFNTCTPATFVIFLMEKNIISNVPSNIANLLEKENAQQFTFHSIRQTSATRAADSIASVQQLITWMGRSKYTTEVCLYR